MAKVALLVSEQRFKQFTSVDENVRTEDITPFILQAQDVYIQNYLGTKFYTRLKNGVINNDLTVNEEEFLNDYVAPTLMQWALYLMLPSIKYRLVDKGLVSGTSEETAPTSLDELKYLRQTVMDTSEFYNKRMVEFLCDNPSMFPEYENPGVDGMYPDRSNPYFSGLVVPRMRGTGLKKYPGCDDCYGYTNLL